ncbi:high mobility group box domain-containing protein [Chlamydoabsidia padenii]|nr:high mobility group box domain-containing protein [Chlamydoabsidia padenii]
MVKLGKLLAEKETNGSAAATSAGPTTKKRVKKDVNAPKKNYSSYLHYCMANRERLMKAHPALGQPDVAKLLGEEWRNLTDAQKEPFRKSADADKERYEKEMAEYKPATEEESEAAASPAKKRARTPAAPKPASPKPAAADSTPETDDSDDDKSKEKKSEKKTKKAKKSKKDKK